MNRGNEVCSRYMRMLLRLTVTSLVWQVKFLLLLWIPLVVRVVKEEGVDEVAEASIGVAVQAYMLV
jgi:hypothetical protein